MRKYRSGGFFLPFTKGGSLADVLKNTNFLYIFVSWNVFAYCAYKWYEKKKVKDKEKWGQMSSGKYIGVDILNFWQLTDRGCSQLNILYNDEGVDDWVGSGFVSFFNNVPVLFGQLSSLRLPVF